MTSMPSWIWTRMRPSISKPALFEPSTGETDTEGGEGNQIFQPPIRRITCQRCAIDVRLKQNRKVSARVKSGMTNTRPLRTSFAVLFTGLVSGCSLIEAKHYVSEVAVTYDPATSARMRVMSDNATRSVTFWVGRACRPGSWYEKDTSGFDGPRTDALSTGVCSGICGTVCRGWRQSRVATLRILRRCQSEGPISKALHALACDPSSTALRSGRSMTFRIMRHSWPWAIAR